MYVQQQKYIRPTLRQKMIEDFHVELRDLLSRRFIKHPTQTPCLIMQHPIYGSSKINCLYLDAVQLQAKNDTTCFAYWKNLTLNDSKNWFPFHMQTVENLENLERHFPNYRKKIVTETNKNDIARITGRKRKQVVAFDDGFDDFSNKFIIDQVNSLTYFYSWTQSRMDQIKYLSLCTFLSYLHKIRRRLYTQDDVIDVVNEFTEHDNEGRRFLTKVAQFYIKFDINDVNEDTKRLKTIYGVGDMRSRNLFAKGIHDIHTLRSRLDQDGSLLPSHVKRVLPYHEDLQKRIPRSEVEQIGVCIEKYAKILCPHIHVEIMGSYCRGASSCGDIDILMTCPEWPSMSATDYTKRVLFLHSLLTDLKSEGVIQETMTMTQMPKTMNPIHVKGSVMFMGVTKISDTYRHIDIKVYPHDLLPFCQLHFAGSRTFSRSMRWYTRQKGYMISELGLRKLPTQNSSDSETELEDNDIKVHRCSNIQTEQDIFQMIRVTYVPPELR